jgi:thiamine-phosphate pyrophosphorylase
MFAAEAGADYVMFGEPDQAGRRPAFDAIIERVAWWAEVFEIPCVGFAASLDEVQPLAAAGADFIALGDCVFADARGAVAALADAVRRLSVAESV